MDEPPIHLAKNLTGKSIVRGTTEVEMDENGEINFANVVINEVSSHYTNNAFNLVIANVTSDKIMPLIIPSLFVKARKSKSRTYRRKRRTID